MNYFKLTIFLLLPFFFIRLQAQNITSSNKSDYKKGEIIIKLKDIPQNTARKKGNTANVGIAALHSVCKQIGTYEVEQFGKSFKKLTAKRSNRPNTNNILILKYEEDIDVKASVEKLMETGLLVYAEPNYIGKHDATSGNAEMLMPNDYTNRLYWAHNDGTFMGYKATHPAPVIDADIDAVEAWDITTGNPNITAAFLDSGIDLTNEEFTGRIVAGFDFANEDNDPTDDHSHGTNVTGLATMTGSNNFGLAGMDWQCKIMPVKVLNADGGFTNSSDVSEGLYYAVDNGANVINMSLGFTNNSQTLHDAINYAYINNVTIVASMGNSDTLTNRWPASYPETIAVGATDLNDHRVRKQYTDDSWGSNYGDHIDVCAPGNSMVSARHDNNQTFSWWKGGTSQATPLVTGTVSLLLSIDPTLTPEQIRTILRSTAEDQVGDSSEDTYGYDIYHGAGRLNAHQALLSISSNCTLGAACDDGDICTTGETYGQYCICGGGVIINDADSDGICDQEDVCNNFDDNLIGQPCNDGDPCTIGEIYNSNCNCEGGIYQDFDYDGICAYQDPDDNDGCNPDANHVNCLPCTSYNFENFNDSTGLWNEGPENTVYGTFEGFCNSGKCFELDNGPYDGGTIFTDSLDFSNYIKVNLFFSFFADGIDPGEFLALEISNSDSSFTQIRKWIVGRDFDNNTRYSFSHTIDFNYLSANNVIRLRAFNTSNGDEMYIDDIEIEACSFDDPLPNCTPGASCDDGNPDTINDAYLPSCICTGTYIYSCADSDNDGVCDADDQCPGKDDKIDSDSDAIPDGCDDCLYIYSDMTYPNITSDKQAKILIQSNGTILPGNDIRFHAGDRIQFLEGFKVAPGTKFSAFIEACQ